MQRKVRKRKIKSTLDYDYFSPRFINLLKRLRAGREFWLKKFEHERVDVIRKKLYTPSANDSNQGIGQVAHDLVTVKLSNYSRVIGFLGESTP